MTDKEDLTAVIYIKSLSDFSKMYVLVSLYFPTIKESLRRSGKTNKERRKRNRETEQSTPFLLLLLLHLLLSAKERERERERETLSCVLCARGYKSKRKVFGKKVV